MSELIATDYYDVIVGFGSTGRSVARYLEKKSVPFIVLDTRVDQKIADQFHQAFPGREIILGALPKDVLLGCRRVVLSPGVSRKDAVIAQAIKQGVTVIGDIQLFLEETRVPTIGITGSNGKTTVTTLIGNIAKRAGKKVAVGGNIGTPALDLLDESVELNVLELSSFQLESVLEPKLKVACILNVTPDHMDRYASLQEYCLSKQKIYRGAESVVCNRDDALTIPPLAERTRCASFGLQAKEDVGDVNYRFDREGQQLCRNLEPILDRSQVKMTGDHNIANALAALAIAEMTGISIDHVTAELNVFKGLPHRCQWVAEINGVTFINDSKGTNVGATIAAIAGIRDQYAGLVLIAGGEGKGADFSALGESIAKDVKATILIGVDRQRIGGCIPSNAEVFYADSMQDAVRQAFSKTAADDAVLLSPGCASFDMYSGYEQRGNTFIQEVQRLC